MVKFTVVLVLSVGYKTALEIKFNSIKKKKKINFLFSANAAIN